MSKKEREGKGKGGCEEEKGGGDNGGVTREKKTGSAREWEMKAMGEEKERKEEKLAADRIDWK